MLLWCLWSATTFDQPPELVTRKAADVAMRWAADVTEPVRRARRRVKPMNDPTCEKLYASLKSSELLAEEIVQRRLEALARENLGPSAGGDAESIARKTLAAYARMSSAPKTEGFSVSLLDDLIGLTIAAPQSNRAKAG